MRLNKKKEKIKQNKRETTSLCGRLERARKSISEINKDDSPGLLQLTILAWSRVYFKERHRILSVYLGLEFTMGMIGVQPMNYASSSKENRAL